MVATPWKSIRFHDFENAPLGIVPHTTAPMDLLLAALAGVIHLGCWITGFRDPSAPLILLAHFSRPCWDDARWPFSGGGGARLALPYRNAVLANRGRYRQFSHTVSSLGALTISRSFSLLAGTALASELALWKRPSQAWEIFLRPFGHWPSGRRSSNLSFFLRPRHCLRVGVLGRKVHSGQKGRRDLRLAVGRGIAVRWLASLSAFRRRAKLLFSLGAQHRRTAPCDAANNSPAGQDGF